MLIEFSTVWPSSVAIEGDVAVADTEVIIDFGLLDNVAALVVQLENHERPPAAGLSDGDAGGLGLPVIKRGLVCHESS